MLPPNFLSIIFLSICLASSSCVCGCGRGQRLGVSLSLTCSLSKATRSFSPFHVLSHFLSHLLSRRRLGASLPFTCSLTCSLTCSRAGDSECANCNTGFMECFGWNEYNQSDVPQCLDGRCVWGGAGKEGTCVFWVCLCILGVLVLGVCLCSHLIDCNI
jgi:hypothetical protein